MITGPHFAAALAFVLDHEGGYVNHPRDPGGETNMGISRRAYPDEDIAAMTRERAAELYHRDYWLPARCDALAWPLCAVVFDAAVNHGVKRAVQLLQDELSVMADGKPGPVTLASAARERPARLALQMIAARERLYNGLAIADSRRRVFLRGWLNRMGALRELVRTQPEQPQRAA